MSDDAWIGAEEGADRAADHAERVDPGWKDAALSLFQVFAEQRGDAGFRTEEARVFAEGEGLTPPPDGRSWGHIALRARRAGIVVKIGTQNTKTGPAHTHPSNHWRIVASPALTLARSKGLLL